MTGIIKGTHQEEIELSAKEQLLALGQDQGYITLDDVLAVFPEAENNLDHLDDVFQALLEAGVEIGGLGSVRSTEKKDP